MGYMPAFVIKGNARALVMGEEMGDTPAFVIDDTTNVTRARGPIAMTTYEVGHNLNQEFRSGMRLLRL
jgi:hypothetical protein